MLDDAKIPAARAEFDPRDALSARCCRAAGWIVAALLFALSCFHYYTAGFGLLQETTHRGVHIWPSCSA